MSEMSEQQAPQVSGSMFLYERPELMSKEQHGALTIKMPEQRYAFCAKARAIPVVVTEIASAMRDFPIVFLSQEQPVPLAITGLVDDVNLFVDENGHWEQDRYIPAYIRRYPFGIASETGGDRIAVVIDTAFEGFGQEGGEPLFENGEPSKATQEIVEFSTFYERDRRLTEDFARKVASFDLIQGQSAQFTPKGETEPRTFAEYFSIDETRLKALTDDQILELHREGMLPIIHAIMMSMSNWQSMLQRRARRFNLSEADVLKNAMN